MPQYDSSSQVNNDIQTPLPPQYSMCRVSSISRGAIEATFRQLDHIPRHMSFDWVAHPVVYATNPAVFSACGRHLVTPSSQCNLP